MFCREQHWGINQNKEKIKKYFLQGTARRPEARPEGRGREEERKAPSYGNFFFIYILLSSYGNIDCNDDDGGGGNVVGGRKINYQKVMTMHCTVCKRWLLKLSEERKTPYQMFLEDDGPYSRWAQISENNFEATNSF